jgi:hypothetical protein
MRAERHGRGVLLVPAGAIARDQRSLPRPWYSRTYGNSPNTGPSMRPTSCAAQESSAVENR